MSGDELTIKHIYRAVRRLEIKLELIASQVDDIADHENRLRSLEKWRYALPGSLILAFASFTVAITEVFR